MSDSEFVEAAKDAVQKIVDETPSESNLMIHARRELELLGEEPEIVEGYLKMIQIFADMDHSGGSASVFIPTLTRLLWFKNLTPLTDDPDEWIHHTAEVWGEPGGVWQNVRNGEAFSDDGGKTYTLLSEEAPVKGGHKPIHISHDHTKPFEHVDEVETVQDAIFAENTDQVNVDPEAGKYGRIFTERGHFEDYEPVFLIRGRDKFATVVIQHYIDLCEAGGATMEHINGVIVQKLVIAEWQRENGSKLPD